MQWTNLFKLPQPLAEAIMEDMYYGKREEGLLRYCEAQGLARESVVHFSVGELIKPPRVVTLLRRHKHEVIKDVASEIYRVLGTAVHFLLWSAAKRMNERGDKPYYTAEERLFYYFHVQGRVVVVSGEPDLVSPEDVIDDYKVTGVWSLLKGVKDEWEKQLNLYAMFRTMAAKVTKGLRICFVLRDWNVNETVQEGYPPAGAQMAAVSLWPFAEQEAYLKGRIQLHLEYLDDFDDELPECSSEEMWEKPDAYAVIRQGGKRAAKVFTSDFALQEARKADPEASSADASAHALGEAERDKDDRNGRLKKGEAPYDVEHRPGERTKCLRFCDARQFCSQFKEYASTFKEKEAAL